jgi:phosphohistidine phosphatase
MRSTLQEDDMKILLIMRHAKAVPNSPEGDKKRDLEFQGVTDAAVMGSRVLDRIGSPDFLIASDAVRAQRTAELFAGAIGTTAPIAREPAIYEADAAALLNVIHAFPNGVTCAVLVGHNPGVAELTGVLSGQMPSHFPTAAVAHLEVDVESWDEVAAGGGRLVEIYMPKGLGG